MINKSDNAYKTIGEVAKILQLKSKKNGLLSTHTIRFWEKEFKQIKPKLLNSNRRYYDRKTIDILKKIKFLLKDQGMTINGVKKILNNIDNKVTHQLMRRSSILICSNSQFSITAAYLSNNTSFIPNKKNIKYFLPLKNKSSKEAFTLLNI